MPRSPGVNSRGSSLWAFIGAASVVPAIALGCARNADSSPPPTPLPAAKPYAEAVYEAEAVDVALLEYAIGMPSRLPPGPTVLRLSNQGFEMHNLKLVDPASGELLWETESDVNTGEVRLVELDLSPGSYTMLCDVAGHDSRGMLMTLTVEASSAP